jgi:hypothetical protein
VPLFCEEGDAVDVDWEGFLISSSSGEETLFSVRFSSISFLTATTNHTNFGYNITEVQ